jgi:hypothetical protein
VQRLAKVSKGLGEVPLQVGEKQAIAILRVTGKCCRHTFLVLFGRPRVLLCWKRDAGTFVFAVLASGSAEICRWLFEVVYPATRCEP